MALAVAQALRPASLPVRKYGDSVLPGLSSRDTNAAGDRAVAVSDCKSTHFFINGRKKNAISVFFAFRSYFFRIFAICNKRLRAEYKR